MADPVKLCVSLSDHDWFIYSFSVRNEGSTWGIVWECRRAGCGADYWTGGSFTAPPAGPSFFDCDPEPGSPVQRDQEVADTDIPPDWDSLTIDGELIHPDLDDAPF